MARPGVQIISRALPLPRSAPTDTGVAFMVGDVGTPLSGTTPYALVHSMAEYEALFGARSIAAGQLAYDSADVYFREGGSRLYVSPSNPTGASGTPDAKIQAALDRLTVDLGPGQVFVAHTSGDSALTCAAQLAHAAAKNRIALLWTDEIVFGALQTFATGLQSDANARYGGLFAPQALVPGSAGVLRTVPYAAVEAGIIARNDISLNPNIPSAGVNGAAVYAVDVQAKFTDQNYTDLNVAGANMAKLIYGGVQTYGYRTLVNPTATPQWLSLGNARLNMAIVAAAQEIAGRYVFTQLDGRRRTISDFGGELSAMLVPYYEKGALYGDTADEAFRVDVGVSVNTAATIAASELHAVIEVRMSPFAEMVIIEIVKVATTEALAA